MQSSETVDKIRIDKWLWQARFFKTRSLAAKVIGAGHVRVNSQKIAKPAVTVKPQDVLTFAQAREIRVVRILALGDRRGPASEAQTLYEDLTPQAERPLRDNVAPAPRYEGKGRPTKRERRKLDLNRPGTLE